uniref:Conotoxin n=1 Tax=Conus praecellens TaxID=128530 RepID=A0A291C2C3_CONPC|nr:conotoxin [Conus praecellens]
MTSLQSVTCCCLLWLMLSVQLVTPGSPGTAQLSGHRTARVPTPYSLQVVVCPKICPEANPLDEKCPESCTLEFWGIVCCFRTPDVFFSSITRRKRSMAV